jgi:hypothetical protein
VTLSIPPPSAGVGVLGQPPFHLYVAPTATPTLPDRLEWGGPLRPIVDVLAFPVLKDGVPPEGGTRYVGGFVVDCRGSLYPLAARGLQVSLAGVAVQPSLVGQAFYWGADGTLSMSSTSNTGNFIVWLTGPPDLAPGKYEVDAVDPTLKRRRASYTVGVTADSQMGVVLFPPTSQESCQHDD